MRILCRLAVGVLLCLAAQGASSHPARGAGNLAAAGLPESAAVPAAERRAAIEAGTPQLYTVATSHLDTQWRWTIQETIEQYLRRTLDNNFALFEDHPNYVFSFEGSFRYRLMAEYYPERFERLRDHVRAGRWRVAGSWVDAVDTNIPSPESLIRHVLYGNDYFRDTFGMTSRDVFLPDCFGFGYALPTVAAHCGLLGFSTQKLTWGSAVGIPFDIGLWQGLDGSVLVSALNPGAYVADLEGDQSRDSVWVARARGLEACCDLPVAYRYFGTGDTGGSPSPESVAQLETSLASDGPLAVRSVASDDLARDLTAQITADLSRGLRPAVTGTQASTSWLQELAAAEAEEAEEAQEAQEAASGGTAEDASIDAAEAAVGDAVESAEAGAPGHDDGGLTLAEVSTLTGEIEPALARLQALPLYDGELLMTSHGAGCYTSQSAMKRWNRQNERLADAAERLAVMAGWVGGYAYPRALLRQAWERFLWHQFHDDLTGTSIPEAYAFSWNDEILSLNQFAGVLTGAAASIGRHLDTATEGAAVLVYNSLAAPREDIVEGTVVFEDGVPEHVRVFGPDGREVPAQVVGAEEDGLRIAFLGRMPPLSVAVYDVRPSAEPPQADGGLSVSPRHLENWRYRVEINEAGDIARVFDKRLQREMLAAPAQLQLLDDSPRNWAAWEVDYDDLLAAPRAVVAGPAEIRVVEQGPARVAVEVTRTAEGSTFRQRISLATGAAGIAIPIEAQIDWRTKGTLLKAAFPLAVANEEAAYDLGLGAVARPTNTPGLYEVPAQQWADITTPKRDYGVTVLSDCRYGWDKPDDHTVRLTLLHTPEVNPGWGWIADQATQDLGRHRLRYGLYGHRGTWRHGNAHWVADGFAQPLFAFQVPRHQGLIHSPLSLVRVRTVDGHAVPQVAVTAIKRAERSDEIIVRLQERAGLGVRNAVLEFGQPIQTVREVNGAEEPVDELAGERAGERAGDRAGEAVAGGPAASGGMLRFSLQPFEPRAFAIRLEPLPLETPSPAQTPVELAYNWDGVSTDADPTDGDFSGHGHTLAGELYPGEIVHDGVRFELGPTGPGAANLMAAEGQAVTLPTGAFDTLYLLTATAGEERRVAVEFETASGARVVETFWIQHYAEPIGQWDSRIRGRELIEDPAQIVPAYVKRQPVAWVGTHCHDPAGANAAYAFTYLFAYQLPVPPDARVLHLPDEGAVRLAAATLVDQGARRARPIAPLYDEPDVACVRIQTDLTEFVDSTTVALGSPNRGAVVRYTLDGTEPGEASAAYEAPITIRDDTVLRARAYAPGLRPEFVARAVFTRLVPQAALSAPAALTDGLACDGYHGAWEAMPALDALAPAASWIQTSIEIPARIRDRLSLPAGKAPEDFALRLRGFIEVPQTGLYTIYLTSDDGSLLWINGELVIDNDGLHGAQTRQANVALAAGLHRIEVQFFQHLGGAALGLEVAGPGFERRPVPEEWLRVLMP